MRNEAMPKGREYVVVTRVRMPLSQRYLVHVYGPYGQAKAKSVKSNIKHRNAEIEVSVCHVLDPEGLECGTRSGVDG